MSIAYNQCQYIKDALESFVSQVTDFPYEIIVHDDASTDGTREIIQKYEKRYPDKIKAVYQKENQYSKGVNVYEDIAVKKAGGKYIALCEGDDYWTDKKKLQKQADFLDTHKGYSACAHSTKIINCVNGNERIYHAVKRSYTLTPEDVILWDQKRFQTSSLMYRRKLVKKPHELKVSGMVDYPLALWLLSVGNIYYMKDVMSVYRQMAAGSWSEKRSKMNQLQIKKALVKEVNRMLDFYDIFTHKKYSVYINAVKRRGETDILSAKGNYKMIVWKYKDVWMRYRKKSIIILFFRAYFPKTAKLLEQMRRD